MLEQFKTLLAPERAQNWLTDEIFKLMLNSRVLQCAPHREIEIEPLQIIHGIQNLPCSVASSIRSSLARHFCWFKPVGQ